MWGRLINSYLKNEKNKLENYFNCFICDIKMIKNDSNEVEIGNINKSFYVCSKNCKQKFLSKEIITNLIKFEELSYAKKNQLINEHINLNNKSSETLK